MELDGIWGAVSPGIHSVTSRRENPSQTSLGKEKFISLYDKNFKGVVAQMTPPGFI